MDHASDDNTSTPDDLRARVALEAWFDAAEAGEPADLLELCNGDQKLADRLERVIDGENFFRSHVATETRSTIKQPTERLGGYRLISRLGRGGMGQVFLAEQESLGRLVALKVLDRRNLDDDTERARFRREAEITARLDHPNIVPVFEVGDADGFDFIAMKWLSGDSLDHLVADPESTLVPVDVARIGVAIGRALHEAHRSGVVHRDVKPANIILEDDIPRLLDFGLARRRDHLALTRDGVIPGTLPYVAPERLRGADDDPRSDAYSLGVTLYELLAGHTPFHGVDSEALVRAVLHQPPPRLALPRRAEELGTIIEKTLEKQPERRYASAAELADDLERWMHGEPILARPVGRLGRMWRAVRRRPKTAAAITLSGIVAIGAGVVAVDRNREAQSRRHEASERRRQDHEQLRRQVITIRADIDTGRFYAAQKSLEAVDAIADRLDERDDVDALRRRLEGRLALERLLDELLDRTATNRPQRLARLVNDVERLDVAAFMGDDVGWTKALVALYQGDDDTAQNELHRAEKTGRGLRATSALRVAIDDDDIGDVETAPRFPTTRADERFVAAMALRFSGASHDVLDDTLRVRPGDEPNNMRCLLALAILYAERGETTAARFAIEQARQRLDRETPPILHQTEAKLLVELGRFDAALRTIERIPPEDRGPIDSLVEIDALRGSGQTKQAEAVWATCLRRWGDHPNVLVRRALAEHRVGQVDIALRTTRRIEKVVGDRETRRFAIGLALEIEFAKLLGRNGSHDTRLPENRRDAIRDRLVDLRKRSLDLAQAARSTYPATAGHLVVARCDLQLSGYLAALETLERAVDARPESPQLRLAYGTVVYALLVRGTGSQIELEGYRVLAWTKLEPILITAEFGPNRLTSADLERLLYFAYVMAPIGDRPRIVDLARSRTFVHKTIGEFFAKQN